MRSLIILSFALICISCSAEKEKVSKLEAQLVTKDIVIDSLTNVIKGIKGRPCEWQGNWKAEWSTDPANYPEVKDMEFYMTGAFNITSDSLTVTANGYPGCIFNIDTLSHTQSWKVANDTLFLMNEETAGMTYRVVATYEDRIELQLMEDIFVTLSK